MKEQKPVTLWMQLDLVFVLTRWYEEDKRKTNKWANLHKNGICHWIALKKANSEIQE
jgi:hypothetical protein